MTTRRTVRVVVWSVALLALAACAGPGIQQQVDVVRKDIDKARKSGAYQCAPRELALAEANADFTEAELGEGDFLRAQTHIELAIENVNAALRNSKDCAPKRVLIKTKVDRDGDGILDDVDACPEQPEDKDLFEDEDGCPDPDNDKDNVLDPLDKCPNTPGPAENEGCPYGDRDQDAVNDHDDECPDQPEDKDGDRDADGRPDIDADKDGIEDCTPGCPIKGAEALAAAAADGGVSAASVALMCDACERDPEDKDGFDDADGCPDVDNDKDGILDAADACPNVPGPLENKGCPRTDTDGDGFFDDEDGCPKEPGVRHEDDPTQNGCPKKFKLIVIKKDRIEIKQQVQFDTGKATIKPASAKLLAEVGEAIRDSALSKVIIEGHTDDVGNDEFNMKLSEDRAKSVRQWLVEKERVNPAILEAVGYGETKPIESNRTKNGRQANRRSEFKVER